MSGMMNAWLDGRLRWRMPGGYISGQEGKDRTENKKRKVIQNGAEDSM